MANIKEPNVLISWSGSLSHAIASELRDWLPLVVSDVVPWLSSEDIPKGAGWAVELNKALEKCKCSVVVLTDANRIAPWVLFEAGAIFKALPANRVLTVLCDLKPSQIQGPLAQFQTTEFTKPELLKLCRSIAAALADEPDPRMERHFETYWPSLEQSWVEKLKKNPHQVAAPPPLETSSKVLEEILTTTRELQRSQLSSTKQLEQQLQTVVSAVGGRPLEPPLFLGVPAYTLRLAEPAITKFAQLATVDKASFMREATSLNKAIGRHPEIWSDGDQFIDGPDWWLQYSKTPSSAPVIFELRDFRRNPPAMVG